jgi:hypothetical protein
MGAEKSKPSSFFLKKYYSCQVPQEAEIRKIRVGSLSRQIIWDTLA